MSTFWLKIIAIIAMVVDHVGAVFFPEHMVLRMIGRLTFPIFAFLIAEGAYYTKDLNKYLKRMFIFALLSEIPFDFAFQGQLIYWQHQNVMWTFSLALVAIWVDKEMTERTGDRLVFGVVGMLVAAIASWMHTDYQALGVLMVLVFYAFREKPLLKYMLGTGLMMIFGVQYTLLRYQMWQNYYAEVGNPEVIWQAFENWLVPNDYIQASACFAFPLTASFNGKKGIGIKYFFYVFYPLHLMLIGVIAQKILIR